MNKRSGISLIVLVITIIIIIVLAGTVILSLASNNPIDTAREAEFKKTLAEYNNELTLWLSNEYLETLGSLDVTTINITKDMGTYENLRISDIITIMSEEDSNIFEIQEGKLVYTGIDENEIAMVIDVGIQPVNSLHSSQIDEEIIDLVENQGYIPIATADELNNIRYSTSNTFGSGTMLESVYIGGMNKKYIQVNNIDLISFSNWESIGSYDEDPFLGIYDGHNFKITNLSINNPSLSGGGLFGYALNAKFDNMALESVNVSGYMDLGGIVGYLEESEMNKCYSTGLVNSIRCESGGLVGASDYSTISECFSSATVTCSNNDMSPVNIGGLIGYSWNSNIINCYSAGVVQGSELDYEIGGLIGWAPNTTVINCYSMSSVNGDGTGGLIGGAFGLTLTNSFYDSQTSGQSDIGKGTPRSTVQMMMQSNFTGWDFTDIWIQNEGSDYPRLRFE